MLNRLNQLSRHISRPLPRTKFVSPITSRASFSPLSSKPSSIMTSSVVPSPSKTIHTAACLIIGDEVLGGKTIDTNSAFFAKYCFSLGIQLKRVEVIADDESEIIEAVRRMSNNYDFVVTSGGIGPTHDDITYESIAKAFNLPLKLHTLAFERMKRLSKPHPMQPQFDWDTPSPGLTAKLRMVYLPHDENLPAESQALFVADDMWVPIAVVNGNVHILPGVPRLFERLLEHLKPVLLPRLANPEGKGIYRYLFSTPLPESAVAPYLTDLAARASAHGVKVGSYPRWGNKRNTVTLVGTDKAFMDSVIAEVEENVQGKKVSREDELDPPSESE
ncbi:molybdopterin binding domain protein [Aspergillus udagawae]|uniref:FAD1 flavin adenine dinucleotide synthetase n=1 Tax=Aspergillus udagawae TaxID=91492 RepID=A0A8H3XLE7_9EURO|nr:FAD1 flavin adenine dinucleotide synthetase [Aspergillus udagawae]GFF52945.1 molybdopterin binding domain protein [Aspergillus udagawae]GIC89353.1 FAD1 flavin adenine dinucleotide synthetase [Aspergillus udagawae]